MSKLKKASHDFYVVVNGGYYRPEKGPDDYPLAPGVRVFVSSFKEGEQVDVKNISRTPYCKVVNSKFIEEVWVFHGPVNHAGKHN